MNKNNLPLDFLNNETLKDMFPEHSKYDVDVNKEEEVLNQLKPQLQNIFDSSPDPTSEKAKVDTAYALHTYGGMDYGRAYDLASINPNTLYGRDTKEKNLGESIGAEAKATYYMDKRNNNMRRYIATEDPVFLDKANELNEKIKDNKVWENNGLVGNLMIDSIQPTMSMAKFVINDLAVNASVFAIGTLMGGPGMGAALVASSAGAINAASTAINWADTGTNQMGGTFYDLSQVEDEQGNKLDITSPIAKTMFGVGAFLQGGIEVAGMEYMPGYKAIKTAIGPKVITNAITKSFKTKAKELGIEYLKGIAGEASEEFFQAIVEDGVSNVLKENSNKLKGTDFTKATAQETLTKGITASVEAARSMILAGMLTGGAGHGVNYAVNRYEVNKTFNLKKDTPIIESQYVKTDLHPSEEYKESVLEMAKQMKDGVKVDPPKGVAVGSSVVPLTMEDSKKMDAAIISGSKHIPINVSKFTNKEDTDIEIQEQAIRYGGIMDQKNNDVVIEDPIDYQDAIKNLKTESYDYTEHLETGGYTFKMRTDQGQSYEINLKNTPSEETTNYINPDDSILPDVEVPFSNATKTNKETLSLDEYKSVKNELQQTYGDQLSNNELSQIAGYYKVLSNVTGTSIKDVASKFEYRFVSDEESKETFKKGLEKQGLFQKDSVNEDSIEEEMTEEEKEEAIDKTVKNTTIKGYHNKIGSKQIITFSTSKDNSTIFHEMGHAFRTLLTPKQLAVFTEAYKGTPGAMWISDIKHNGDGTYSLNDDLYTSYEAAREVVSPNEERFADDSLAYFQTGKAPNEEMKGLFQKFRQFLKSFINAFRNRLSDSTIKAFDDVINGVYTDSKLTTDASQELSMEEVESVSFQIEEKYNPKVIGHGYKLFEQDTTTGEVYPLFIGSKTPTPINEWAVAENMGKQKGFALRPGWHIGSSLPDAPWLKGASSSADNIGQYNSKRGKNFKRVWAAVSYPMDVKYQDELEEAGKKDIKNHIPTNGFYNFRETNGLWIIAGAVRIDKVLTDKDRAEIFKKQGYDESKEFAKHSNTPAKIAAIEKKEIKAAMKLLKGKDNEEAIEILNKKLAKSNAKLKERQDIAKESSKIKSKYNSIKKEKEKLESTKNSLTEKQYENKKAALEKRTEIANELKAKNDQRLENAILQQKHEWENNINNALYKPDPEVRDNSMLRYRVPQWRGKLTKEKIIKYLKEMPSGSKSTWGISKVIAQFDDAEDLFNHIYYHGTGGYSSSLLPSITFSDTKLRQVGGGGYGERYWGISVTKRKRTAEKFSGESRSVSVYPIILDKNAKVEVRTDLEDAIDLEDHIIELWENKVDAVWIGGGEQELVVLNPRAIHVYGRNDNYAVFGGFKSENMTLEKAETIYNKAKEYAKITRKEIKDISLSNIQFQTEKKLLAPNGKPSNLSEELYNKVRTPEFINWFGDWINDPEHASKVLDENGEPLVVYHGSKHPGFTKFEAKLYDNYMKKMDKGEEPTDAEIIASPYFYFSENIKAAQSYGKDVYNCFLNVKNPRVLDWEGEEWGDGPEYAYTDDTILDGYDGSYIKNIIDGGHVLANEWIVIESNQIKSIDNVGTFDPNADNILYQTVFHGTAYKFDKFLTDYIGTGAKLATFGWGLYFTQEQEIAKIYAKGVYKNGLKKEENKNKIATYTIDKKPFYDTGYKKGSKEEKFANFVIKTGYQKYIDKKTEAEIRKRHNEVIKELEALLINPKLQVASLKGITDEHRKEQLKKYNKQIRKEQKEDKIEIQEILEEIKLLDEGLFNRIERNTENPIEATLYTVTIPDTGYIRWTDPVSEDFVNEFRENLLSLSSEIISDYYADEEFIKSHEFGSKDFMAFYQSADIFGPKLLSKIFERMGYVGIEFPAHYISERIDKAPYSYVIFNQDSIKMEDSVHSPNETVQFQTEKKLLAPNGKPSNLSEGLYYKVRTPQFKAWFGDWENDPKNASKILDENGEPMVVYHGTTFGKFEIFDKEMIGSRWRADDVGFFFTDKLSTAEGYAKTSDYTVGKDPYLFNVFLNIKNPLIIDKKWSYQNWGKDLITDEDSIWLWDEKQADILNKLKKENDGIIVKGSKKYAGNVNIAFDSNQIKSENNKGTFDPYNDNILFQTEDKRTTVRNEKGSLVVLHNLDARNLEKVYDMGGMPMPSLAVTKPEITHEGFGAITLIGNRDLGNKLLEDGSIYSRDMYSPIVPRPNYKVDTTALNKAFYNLDKKIRPEFKSNNSNGFKFYDEITAETYMDQIERAAKEPGYKDIFLKEQGINVRLPYKKETDLDPNLLTFFKSLKEKLKDEFKDDKGNIKISSYQTLTSSDFNTEIKSDFKEYAKERWDSLKETGPFSKKSFGSLDEFSERNEKILLYKFKEYLINYKKGKAKDVTKLEENIDKKFTKKLTKKYKEWISDLLKPYWGEKQLLDGKKLKPYNINNIFDSMLSEKLKGNAGLFFGFNVAGGAAAKGFKDRKDLAKSEYLLEDPNFQDKTLLEEKKQLKETYMNLSQNAYIYEGSFDALDNCSKVIADYLEKTSKSNIDKFKKSLTKFDFDPTYKNIAEVGMEFAEDIREEPRRYFEAKPQEIMQPSFFKAAIIPSNLDKDLVKKLKQDGLVVKKYVEGKQSEITKQYIDSNARDILFQTSVNPTSVVDTQGSLLALHNTTAEKILAAYQLGGMPMPSIAVTKPEIEHVSFGDITLIGDNKLGNKLMEEGSVFSGDIWSAQAPDMQDIIGDYTSENILQWMIDHTEVYNKEKTKYYGMFGYADQGGFLNDLIKNREHARLLENSLRNVDETIDNNTWSDDFFTSIENLSQEFSDPYVDVEEVFKGWLQFGKTLEQSFKDTTGYEITEDQKDLFKTSHDAYSKMGRKYFEAKPKRVIPFSDFKAAIVPDNTSSLLVTMLREDGLEVEFYDGTTQNYYGNSLTEAVQKYVYANEENILFQTEQNTETEEGLKDRYRKEIQDAIDLKYYIPLSVLEHFKNEDWAKDEYTFRKSLERLPYGVLYMGYQKSTFEDFLRDYKINYLDIDPEQDLSEDDQAYAERVYEFSKIEPPEVKDQLFLDGLKTNEDLLAYSNNNKSYKVTTTQKKGNNSGKMVAKTSSRFTSFKGVSTKAIRLTKDSTEDEYKEVRELIERDPTPYRRSEEFVNQMNMEADIARMGGPTTDGYDEYLSTLGEQLEVSFEDPKAAKSYTYQELRDNFSTIVEDNIKEAIEEKTSSIWEERKDDIKNALISNYYVPDEIVEEFAGEDWADREIEFRKDLKAFGWIIDLAKQSKSVDDFINNLNDLNPEDGVTKIQDYDDATANWGDDYSYAVKVFEYSRINSPTQADRIFINNSTSQLELLKLAELLRSSYTDVNSEGKEVSKRGVYKGVSPKVLRLSMDSSEADFNTARDLVKGNPRVYRKALQVRDQAKYRVQKANGEENLSDVSLREAYYDSLSTDIEKEIAEYSSKTKRNIKASFNKKLNDLTEQMIDAKTEEARISLEKLGAANLELFKIQGEKKDLIKNVKELTTSLQESEEATAKVERNLARTKDLKDNQKKRLEGNIKDQKVKTKEIRKKLTAANKDLRKTEKTIAALQKRDLARKGRELRNKLIKQIRSKSNFNNNIHDSKYQESIQWFHYLFDKNGRERESLLTPYKDTTMGPGYEPLYVPALLRNYVGDDFTVTQDNRTSKWTNEKLSQLLDILDHVISDARNDLNIKKSYRMQNLTGIALDYYKQEYQAEPERAINQNGYSNSLMKDMRNGIDLASNKYHQGTEGRFAKGFHGFENGFIHIQRAARMLDGNKEGVLYNFFVRDLQYNYQSYYSNRQRRLQELDSILKDLKTNDNYLSEKIFTYTPNNDEKNTITLTREEVITSYIYSLNKKGIEKLMSPAGWGMSEETLMDLMDLMEDKDIKLAKELMRTIGGDEEFDRYSEAAERIYNVNVGREENYFPFRSIGKETDESQDLLVGPNASSVSYVDRGRTKERVQTIYKLDLKGLNTWHKVLDEQERMIAFGQWVKDSNYLLGRNSSLGHTVSVRYGQTRLKNLQDFTNRVAKIHQDLADIERLTNIGISNFAASRISFSLSSAMHQITSITQGVRGDISLPILIQVLTLPHVVGGYKMGQAKKEMEEKDPTMKNRCFNLEISRFRDLGHKTKVERDLSKFADIGMAPSEFMDSEVTVRFWWGVYLSTLKKGSSEKEAIFRASQFIAETQSTSNEMDLSGVQSGKNPFFRALAQFKNDNFQHWNQMRFDLPYFANNKMWGKFLGTVMSNVLGAAIFTASAGVWIPQGDDEDDKGVWTKRIVGEILKQLLEEFLPFIGQGLSAAFDNYTNRDGLVEPLAFSGVKFGRELLDGDGDTEELIEKMYNFITETTGLATGFPTTEADRVYNAIEEKQILRLIGGYWYHLQD